MDNIRIAFHLTCGCEFSFRTPSRETLLAGLSLDPLVVNGAASLSSCKDLCLVSPKWLEVNVKRPCSHAKLIVPLLICLFVHLLVTQLVKPIWIGLIPIFLLSAYVFRQFHNTVIEETMLVAADFGIQTRVCFSSGRQSASRFIPIDCLRGVLLMDRVTPFTVTPYLAAQLEMPASCRHPVDVKGCGKPERKLFPLLPTHLTHDEKHFSSHICLPLPTLVFVYRLIYLVCCPSRLAPPVKLCSSDA